ncbi:hypothetical protein BDY19DRAFT_951692 [Irpex rosettiformis]|uniref:Uncharacterized protein n=1 Tax=Irpex rosettiformis TaxID=378272 RepID=A0ACB8U116_9APHY|nr:hypothetical protein BDY19DRAFT_951692 [Irpex rosettiformis]
MLSTRPLAPGDDGQAQYTYARTPAKGLLKTRGALQENTVYRGQRTVNGKGKAVALRTPQPPASLRKNGLQTTKPTLVVTRPLGDKTPFPNRQAQALQTPAPQAAKLAKLALFDESLAKTPGNLLLPSARRKSVRLPRSASKKFQTPQTQGNPWDVSDGDVHLDISQEIEEAAIEESDYDEVEYQPPKVPDQPFEPLFGLLDYKAVGKILLDLEYSGPRNNATERFYAADMESVIDKAELLKASGGLSWHGMELTELPDGSPFRRSPTPSVRAPSASSLRPRSRTSSEKPVPTRVAPSRVAQSSTKPAPPVTRSSTRVLSTTAQNTTTHTRITRSTSARSADQTTQPTTARQTTTREPVAPAANRSTTSVRTRAATTRSTVLPTIRPPSVTESRTRGNTSGIPAHTIATPSRARPATLARVDNSRPSSRAGSELSTSTAPTRREDEDDFLNFDCDDTPIYDDFQLSL